MAIYLALVLLGTVAVYLIENNSKTGWFLVAVFLFLCAAFDLAGLGSVAAVLAALGMFGAVAALSSMKRRMTRFPLFYNDLLAFDRSVFRDILLLYRREALIALAICLVLAAPAAWAQHLFDFDIGLWAALGLGTFAAIGMSLTVGRALKNMRGWMIHRALVSAFFAQAIDQRLMRADMRRLELMPAEPEGNLTTSPAVAKANAPHVIVVSHESTFPPSLYGYPEEEDIAEFFRGRDGGRSLVTEIFGGQSIMTSFACQTGLSTTIFGPNRFYATRFWAGRIHVSLPSFLAEHGYRTRSILSVDGRWMGLGDFYRSIGFERVLEPGDYASEWTTEIHAARDSVMFSGAVAEIARVLKEDGSRSYTLVETLGNHGPHNFCKFDDPRVAASRAWFVAECAHKGLPTNPEMAEYYARLRATVDDYRTMMAQLEAEHPGQAFVVVNIGDHQPSLVSKLAPDAGERQYLTFLSVDTIGTEIAASLPGNRDDPWPVFNVDLAVALYAGLPLNGFLAGKMRVIEAAQAPDGGIFGTGYAGLVHGLQAAGLIRPA